ncbi:DUF1593 domain-containing protein [Propioniciclava soli]|uniref:DUF1593 domain-containing protein n=1 Tax=Propioniciclava soli TaxID=2775081 RepID=UPI001E2E93BE
MAPPRTIVTTDPELDDLNSMLRFLLYSNEVEILGLVYASSRFHYAGDPDAGVAPHRWPAEGDRLHIDEAVDAYAQVYDRLRVHAEGYPSPGHLRSLIAMGNVAQEGEYATDTPGSLLIREALLADDPRRLFVQVWGGPATLASALRSIQTEFEGTDGWDALHARISAALVITAFWEQDASFAEYIRPNWPAVEFRDMATMAWGYGTRRSVLAEHHHYLAPDWTRQNVSEVGPMGAAYRVWGDGKFMAPGDTEDYFGHAGKTADELRAQGYEVWIDPEPAGAFISEGDSSTFALLVDNGLRAHEDPTWGGWGGRQVRSDTDPHTWTNHLVLGPPDAVPEPPAASLDAGPDGEPRRDYAAARWWEFIQRDFAARLRWSVTERYADANHHPVVAVQGDLDRTVSAGDEVRVVAEASDPDGDSLSARWWQYREAGTYPGEVALESSWSAAGLSCSFVVPDDARAGQTIHVLLEVTDVGAPALTRWQRVVVTIG